MPSLLDPIRIGSLELPNRVFMSPLTRLRGAEDNIPTPLMIEYYQQRAEAGLIFTEWTPWAWSTGRPEHLGPALKKAFGGAVVLNEGYTRETAEEVVEHGEADAVAFGKLFIANPDLPRRFAEDAPLNAPVPQTFYAAGAEGYVDYPALPED